MYCNFQIPLPIELLFYYINKILFSNKSSYIKQSAYYACSGYKIIQLQMIINKKYKIMLKLL